MKFCGIDLHSNNCVVVVIGNCRAKLASRDRQKTTEAV